MPRIRLHTCCVADGKDNKHCYKTGEGLGGPGRVLTHSRGPLCSPAPRRKKGGGEKERKKRLLEVEAVRYIK